MGTEERKLKGILKHVPNGVQKIFENFDVPSFGALMEQQLRRSVAAALRSGMLLDNVE